MDEDFCYCHNDYEDEEHDCLDYMECEECPYYYADLDQGGGMMERLTEVENGTAMVKGCGSNCKYGFEYCRKED